MNTNRLNQWLTLGANVGVLAGIILLAYELRQNNDLLQAEASVAYVELRSNSLMDMAQSDGLLNALVSAKEGAELSEKESLRLNLFYLSVFVNLEWEFEQYILGALVVLDQPPKYRWRPAFDRYPLMREYWAVHKAGMSPSFVQYIDAEVLN